MKRARKTTVAVLVATADRTTLLESRALPSIAAQSLPPDRVVVVDDSTGDAAERNERLVRSWRPPGTGTVDFLLNRRTKGAAGAWNSGLDHLLRTCGEPGPERIYVAILDDDDRWSQLHLETFLKTAETFDLDMVAAPFRRIEEDAAPRRVAPPPTLDATDFLADNPGIQGSNMVCRLSVLLEAGLFDESLASCTDRDLCIRIADLPDVRYGVTSETTVDHFACASRPRLSSPRSAAKLKGLDCFYRKYRDRMSDVLCEAFQTRARRYFGWERPVFKAPTRAAARGGAAPRFSPPPQAPPHLIVGVIADTARRENLGGLLADLRGAAGDSGLSGHDVLILENGGAPEPDRALRSLVERERKEGLRVHLVDRARHIEDAASGLVPDGGAARGDRMLIAPARTVLQSYLYAFAKNRPGAVIWIVDDDMRLDPLVIEEDGRLRRRRQTLAPVLRALRGIHAGGELDIAIGMYTGAPPLPFAATVRVQLVDLAASLRWLASLDPRAVLPDRSAENAALRFDRRDYYYDLSRKETDRLETPFALASASSSESVGEAFERLAGAAERIMAGEQVFRPLAIESGIDPLESIGGGLHRGGNTFVFDVEALRLAPNPSPTVDGRPSRRSDMIWALLQERCLGRRVATVPVALYHDRSGIPPGELDVERVVDDIRGYATFSALQDTLAGAGAFTVTDGPGIELSDEAIERFTFLVSKYTEERLAAFRLSFYRVLGLKRVIYQMLCGDNVWWQKKPYRKSWMRLRSFCDRLRRFYTMEALNRIECGAKTLRSPQVREFLVQLPKEIEAHRNRLAKFPALARKMEDERIANAKAVAARMANPGGPLKVLGCGMEGVALRDERYVFKV